MLLTGPLQSWGGPGAGIYERRTESMPSMSGVIGMIANALGRKRAEPIDDLAQDAQLAVRADRPGSPMEDYHTLGNVLNAEGKILPHSVPTRRWYLQDAAFLAVFTPPAGGMPASDVLAALRSPARPLYLGRRSCVPAERVPVCTTGDRNALDVLSTAALLREPEASSELSDIDYFSADSAPAEQVPVLVEMSASDEDGHRASLRPDAPTTFDPRRLFHMNRRVVTERIRMSRSACAGRGSRAVARLYESLGIEP